MIYFENHEIINILTHSSPVLTSTKTDTLSKTKLQILVEDYLTLGFKKMAELWLLADWLTVQEAQSRGGKRMAHPGEGSSAICLQVTTEALVLLVPKAERARVCVQVTACTHTKGEMAASAQTKYCHCGLLLMSLTER